MDMIEIIAGLGDVVAVPVESVCNDGRKIPQGIDLNSFMQLSVFEWQYGVGYESPVFVYNPFHEHPIRKKSIIDAIDPKRRVIARKHRSEHYFWRTFDENHPPDPLYPPELSGLVVFELGMPKGNLFFQCNHPDLDDSRAGLIITQRDNLVQYLSKRYKVLSGSLEKKTSCI